MTILSNGNSRADREEPLMKNFKTEDHCYHCIADLKSFNRHNFIQKVSESSYLIDARTGMATCAHCKKLVVRGPANRIADAFLAAAFAVVLFFAYWLLKRYSYFTIVFSSVFCVMSGMALWWLRKLLNLILPWRALREPLNQDSPAQELLLKRNETMILICCANFGRVVFEALVLLFLK